MEQYLLKSSLIIVVFYLFYFLVIKKETWFKLNRFYLLGGLFLSLILPLLPRFQLSGASPELSALIEGVSISQNLASAEKIKILDLINPLMIIYLSGVTWFSLRFLSGMGRIVYIYFRFPKSTVNDLTTVVLKGDHAPFTFFNILFLSEADFADSEQKGLLEHELAHIRQFHSLDIILVEFACILLWFNPVIWFYRIALKAEHEYAADEEVMKEGYNKLTYQQLLFDRTMGVSALSLANNFNYSLLKNRIKMMTKNKSGNRTRMKYLLAIPMLVLVFACTLAEGNKPAGQDDKLYDVVDVMPEFPGGMQAVRVFIAQNVKYPEIAQKQAVSGKVFVQFTVDEKGGVIDPIIMRTDINTTVEDEVVVVAYSKENIDTSSQKEGILALEEEAIRVVSTIPDFTPGKQDGKAVKVRYTFPISFSLQ